MNWSHKCRTELVDLGLLAASHVLLCPSFRASCISHVETELSENFWSFPRTEDKHSPLRGSLGLVPTCPKNLRIGDFYDFPTLGFSRLLRFLGQPGSRKNRRLLVVFICNGVETMTEKVIIWNLIWKFNVWNLLWFLRVVRLYHQCQVNYLQIDYTFQAIKSQTQLWLSFSYLVFGCSTQNYTFIIHWKSNFGSKWRQNQASPMSQTGKFHVHTHRKSPRSSGHRPRRANFMFTLIAKIADVEDLLRQYLQSRNASDSSDHVVKITDRLGCLGWSVPTVRKYHRRQNPRFLRFLGQVGTRLFHFISFIIVSFIEPRKWASAK